MNSPTQGGKKEERREQRKGEEMGREGKGGEFRGGHCVRGPEPQTSNQRSMDRVEACPSRWAVNSDGTRSS